MKPNFALSLSYDAMELLQRSAGGWLSVGSVRFDNPELDTAIEALVQRARALAPEGITTKLLMPDSEIRFATVLAPGPTDEARRYQIEAEIEGLTPYRLPDLAYDWSVEGDHAQVAIVARETLREAEEFAAERGFNPVSFVALPTSGQFLGEPFFGQTGLARSLLPSGGMVQPDAEAVRIVGKAAAPAPSKPPSATPAPPSPQISPKSETPAAPAAPVAPAAAKPQTQPVNAPPTPVAGAKAAAVPVQAEGLATAAKGPIAPQGLDGNTNLLGGLVRRMGTAIRREQAQAPKPPASTSPGSTSTTAAPASAPTGKTVAPPAAAQPVTAKEPDAPRAEGAVLAFSSRRAAAASGPGGVSATDSPASTTAGTPGGRLAILPRGAKASGLLSGLGDGGRSFARQTLGRLGLLTAVRKVLGRDATGAKLKASTASMAPAAMPRPAAPVTSPAPSAGTGAKAVAATGSTRWTQTAQATALQPESARVSLADRDKLTEAEALTVFGRRGMVQPEPLLPARAMMAIGGVLLVLIAVAVWALYFNRPAATPTGLAQDSSIISDPVASADSTGAITAPAEVPPVDLAAEQPVDLPPVAAEPEAVAAAEPETILAPDEAVPANDPLAETQAPAETAVVDDAVTTDPDVMLEALVREALNDAQQEATLGAAGGVDLPVSGATDDLATSSIPVGGVTDQAATDVVTGSTSDATGQLVPEATSEATVSRLAMPGRLSVPPVDEVLPVSLTPPPAFDAVLAGVAAAAPPAPEPVQPGADAGADAGAEPAPSEAEVVVTVTDGRPTSVPTIRPARIGPPPLPLPAAPAVPEAAQTPAPQPEPVPEPVIADDTPRADPALAGARPEPRSARVTALGAAQRAVQPDPPPNDEAPASQDEQPGRLDQGSLMPDLSPAIATAIPPVARPAALTTTVPEIATETATPPPGGVDLALLRPQRRPTDLVPDPAAATEPDPVDETAPEAVARSLVPSARPQALAARVQTALEAERRRPVATAAAAPAASAPAPQASAAAAAPSIPSSASVQQSATERRAIRTREANLIGVFGAPSNRRALVRMGNGQVVRLQVGDRFDGGQVSAIGDSELRYVRGGRDRVLRIASRG